MIASTRPAAIALALFAALVFPAGASAVEGLPDPAPNLPALPATPTVTVTPGGEGGATVDVGVGGENLHLGAGPGGVSLNRGARNASPGAGGGSGDNLPVSTPGDLPGDRRPSSPGTGDEGGALLFGPQPGSGNAITGESTRAVTRPGSTSVPFDTARDESPDSGADRSRPLPFVEFIDDIPGFVKAGIAALALIALFVWAAWVRARRRLASNAFVDPVTGIANAPAFEGLLASEMERARRYKRPLALLLLDVSEMRQSRLPLLHHRLRQVTGAINDRKRESDMLARLGPSRFAIICPEATAAGAETLARAIESRLEEMRLHARTGMAERQATDLEPAHLVTRAQVELQAHDPGRKPARANPLLRAA